MIGNKNWLVYTYIKQQENEEMSKTPITELDEFFRPQKKTTVIRGIASRFIKPGDTPEQSLARQEESMRRIKEQQRG